MFHTHSNPIYRLRAVTALLLSLALAACGGGGGGGTDPTPATAAPAFSAQPVSITVGAGKPAVFSVTASGKPAPTYQWQFSADGGKTWQNYPGNGATTDTLSDDGSGIKASLNGVQFRVVATNAAGSATSNAATLQVLQPAANAINGVVYAAANSDIKDTLIVACFVVNSKCDLNSANTKVFQVTATGSKAVYQIPGLAAGGIRFLPCRARKTPPATTPNSIRWAFMRPAAPPPPIRCWCSPPARAWISP